MGESGPYKKIVLKDALFFLFLFVLCVAGSVAIFWFAVGVESGNVIIKNFMKSLLDNAVGIVITLVLCNLFLVIYYSKKR